LWTRELLLGVAMHQNIL